LILSDISTLHILAARGNPMIDLAKLISDLSPAKRDTLLRQLNMQSDRPAPALEPITVAESDAGPFPLSFGQQRLWFLQQLEPNNPAYNYPLLISLKGSLDIVALKRSFTEILSRHDALRANFTRLDGQPVQSVRPCEPADLELIDLTHLPADEREGEALSLATREAHRPFDLSAELLWRTVLVRLSEEHHLLILSTHHIVFDGWSLGILMRELVALYRGFYAGNHTPLDSPTFKYVNYITWQRQWLQGERLANLVSYWRKQLKGVPQSLSLPADRPRPQVQTFQGAQQTVTFASDLSEQIRALSKREGVTVFMALLAGFQTLLHAYSGQTDIVIGTDTANRKLLETESLVGFFVNLLVLRTDLSGNPTFRELLARVRETALQAYANDDLPFEKLVETLCPERALGYTPLVQALFLLQNNSHIVDQPPGLALSLREIDRKTSKFDLVVSVSETGSGLACSFNYSTELFDAATVSRMMDHYQTVLRTMAARPEGRLKDISIITETERRHRTMAQSERQVSKFRRLKQGQRKSVDLSQKDMINQRYLRPDEPLPIVIEPKGIDVDLIEWAGENRAHIESELLKHGAILFRGFKPYSPITFESFAATVCGELFGEYGDLPREAISRNIYGSTPYPPDQTILFHNESSHMHRWPLKQFFFCLKAAAQGGETPIVDCRRIYQLLEPDLLERFIQKKIMYVRNFISGLDVSWQDFFKTTDRAEVEMYCRHAGIDFSWKGDDLSTRQICAAVASHPKTGEKVFFNQLQLHHVSSLAPEVRKSMLSLFDEHELPRNVVYGDGTPIEDSVIAQITATYWKNASCFPWQEGDVLMLDNMMTAHARNPFTGQRKIMVAMGEMIDNQAF
jgi:alpha-ketoglutarate-dependent taurine dioxygenase